MNVYRRTRAIFSNCQMTELRIFLFPCGKSTTCLPNRRYRIEQRHTYRYAADATAVHAGPRRYAFRGCVEKMNQISGNEDQNVR